MALSVGSRLGPYEIVALLGAGGMGEVYRARDTRLERDVALKLLTSITDRNARAHLLEEARSAAALNHPHICTVHEIGEADDRLFIVMEYIDGRPLSGIVETGLPTTTAIRYGIQIADALSHAHEHGVVHRDLKDTNLMVTSEGRLKLLDFGIAKRFNEAKVDALTRMPTMTGTVTGTPAYMAPEALRGAPVDRRSDIWALGVVLYEMLAQRRPFCGDTWFEITTAILRDDPEPLEARVPAPLRAVISRCLMKDPTLRYQHAGEVQAALEAVATIDLTKLSVPGQRGPSTVEKSLIVLPFANLSPDPEDAYFSDGLTDELITDLSRVAGLRVVPGASSFRLKSTNKDLAAIAREFSVKYAVEGRVRKAGQSVRITAQLVELNEDRTVWADKYTGDLERAFELQERVSRSIADALQLQLQPASRVPEPAAAEAYLKGRHFARQATTASFQKALEFFNESTRLDANYAPAFGALAYTYVMLSAAWLALPAGETMPKALTAARRALDLNPNLPEAHLALALIATLYDWDPRSAERSFTEALRLNPNYAEAYAWRWAPLVCLDTRFDDGLSHAARAVALNPVDPWARFQLICVHFFSRRFERAIDQARDLIILEPFWGTGYYALGFLLATAQRPSDAIANINRGIELDGRGVHHIAWLGCSYALAGANADARACLAELETHERAGKNVWAWKLPIYSALGQVDDVMRCLTQAFEERSASLVFHLTHPLVDCV